MKLFKKMLAGVAVAAALTTSAQATPITVGGITWDPDWSNGLASPFNLQDFLASFNFLQYFVPVSCGAGCTTQELVGYGEVYDLNGAAILPASTTGGDASSFAPGRELTFTLSDLVVTGTGVNTFTGGSLNIYSDNHNDFNLYGGGTMAQASNTDLSEAWLTLTAVSSQFTSTASVGADPLTSGQLVVQWSVTGGLAADNFDTNFYVTSDVGSRASATFIDGVAVGNGTLTGNSIPEPESLTLVGLGLLGLAASRRRKIIK